MPCVIREIISYLSKPPSSLTDNANVVTTRKFQVLQLLSIGMSNGLCPPPGVRGTVRMLFGSAIFTCV